MRWWLAMLVVLGACTTSRPAPPDTTVPATLPPPTLVTVPQPPPDTVAAPGPESPAPPTVTIADTVIVLPDGWEVLEAVPAAETGLVDQNPQLAPFLDAGGDDYSVAMGPATGGFRPSLNVGTLAGDPASNRVLLSDVVEEAGGTVERVLAIEGPRPGLVVVYRLPVRSPAGELVVTHGAMFLLRSGVQVTLATADERERDELVERALIGLAGS